ncbi:MAG TPA: hypothetical protein VGB83_06695 [Actinomycetota bacterium]
MLDDNDIHRLAGHLYMATRKDDVELVLGERIQDEASGTNRDVDLVLLTSADSGIMGVEVKDHARPLDVGLVEQLCQKLNDMPTLTGRQIASRSGYTGPALKKAVAHGVECLTMGEGPLPDFRQVDLSQLREVRVINRDWAAGAEILFIPNPTADRSAVDALQTLDADQGRLVRVKGQQLSLGEISRRVLKGTLDRLPAQSEPGLHPVDAILTLDMPLEVETESATVLCPRVHIKGTIKLTLEKIPLTEALYLRDPSGVPLAACVLVEINGHLLGLSVAEDVGRLNLISIPGTLRDRRPNQERVGGGAWNSDA